MPSRSPTTSAIITLGLPPKSLVGINNLSLSSSTTFSGITNLPPGLHFLYTGADASLSIRHGQWFRVKPAAEVAGPQILLWHWDVEEECLILREDNEEAAASFRRLVANARGQSGLVAYQRLLSASADLAEHEQISKAANPVEAHISWADLTSSISDGLLDRILKPPRSQSAVPDEIKSTTWYMSSISTAQCDLEHIPGLSSSESHPSAQTPLNFVPVDLKRTWREGAIGDERTESARDRSWYLGSLIDQCSGPSRGDRKVGANRILGEMQLCFLMVLTLANYSCLEQWKRILGLLLSCRKALLDVEEYFCVVLRVLSLQIGHCEDVEGGLFEFKEEGAGGWLKRLLSGLKRNIKEVFGEEEERGKVLKEEIARLEDFMKDTYGWEVDSTLLRRGMLDLEDGERVEMEMNEADEEDEMGEYAPVIVDLE